MRTLGTLLTLLIVLSSIAQPALADNELVVDDDASTVQIQGIWATATGTPGFLGAGYHFRVAGDGTSTFTWPFAGPAGRYEVFARWTSGTNRASNATYVINSADAPASISVN